MDNENFKPSVSAPEIPQKRGGKNLFKIIAGVIILVIAGTGTSLATRAWDPFWNPFRPEPEEVLARMASQLKELKTFSNKTAFALGVKNEMEIKIDGDLSGDYDVADPDNSKSATDFNLNLAMEGMQFSLAGEAKTIGETSYFKLTTIPALPMLEPFFALMGIDLQQFKNQWVKFDEESIKGIFPSEMTEESEKELEEQKKEEKETKEKIEKLIANKELYSVKTELADEKIGKIKTYHYIVALNKEEVKKIIPEILNIIGEKEEMLTGPESQEKIREEINQFFDKIGEITAEVWIGKKDFYLYKLKLEKEIDLSAFEETEEGTVLIKIVMESDKFNQPIEITAPEEFKTIKEILTLKEGLFGPFESERSKARDVRRQSDLRQIAIALQMYYSDKGSYPQSKTIQTLPKIIYLDPLPTDPGNDPCPGPYKWINNVGYPEKYCVYACLENGKYFAASHTGFYELSLPPKTLEDCKKEVWSPISKFPFGIEKFMASIEEAFSGILNK